MNPNAKTEWIRILQLAEKAEGQLHVSGERFSACGALCLAYQRLELKGEFLPGGFFADDHDRPRRAGVPNGVLQWADLDDLGRGIWARPRQLSGSIVAMNDGLGNTKPQSLHQISHFVKLHL